MMTTFFSFLSAVLHLWIAILRQVMESVRWTCDFIIHPFRAYGGAWGGGAKKDGTTLCLFCLLFVSFPCVRATNALCCPNPFASLVFLVRFRSWAAQVSVAGALPVSSLQNLAVLDPFS
jgi:hypothetical protein